MVVVRASLNFRNSSTLLSCFCVFRFREVSFLVVVVQLYSAATEEDGAGGAVGKRKKELFVDNKEDGTTSKYCYYK